MNSCDRATLSRTVRCSFIRRADSPAPYLLMMSKQELLFLHSFFSCLQATTPQWTTSAKKYIQLLPLLSIGRLDLAGECRYPLSRLMSHKDKGVLRILLLYFQLAMS
ncbi:hypothetical protein CDAR_377191 [Caerostris darwini]|uniref:Uncharacterized protein n=1 Tax=Caerostris darwini TaxID=1538125 RepID=A0AAV4SF16_9ARAC|nr:hypothetical protein CDAR_377191 [Caerostris darwini]